jgi:DNA processing protein
VSARGICQACGRCLARTWLLGRLAGHIEQVRGRIQEVLTLDDERLIEAVAGAELEAVLAGLAGFEPEDARSVARAAGLELICSCDPAYPERLFSLDAPPAVLHVAGNVDVLVRAAGSESVAVVGSRRASPYGLDVARSLGRGLGCAGVPVISGMALGIDAAAHAGALDGAGPTIAVMPGAADRAYPPSKRALHRAILERGAAVSELGPGAPVFRWAFMARNRLIAALTPITVVVEAGERSGALVTAALAAGLGRELGAVPGQVTSPRAAGSNRLLAEGAIVIRGAQDVVDRLFGVGEIDVAARARGPLRPELAGLYEAIAAGEDTARALSRAGVPAGRGLAALAELELGGHIRRTSGGRYTVTA